MQFVPIPLLRRLLKGIPRRQLLRGAATTLFWIALGSSVVAMAPLALREIVNDLVAKNYNHVAFYIAFYAGVAWLSRAAAAAQMRSFGLVSRTWRKLLSRYIYQHALNLPHQFFAHRRTGTLTQIVGESLTSFRAVLSALVFGMIPTIVQGTTIVVVLIVLN